LIEVGKDHFSNNRFYEAERCFREEGGDQGNLWLGTLFEWTGDYEKAYEHALLGADNDHRACILARIVKHHGDWREAERACLKFLDGDHGVDVRFELARLYDKVGEFAKAWEHICIANASQTPMRINVSKALTGKWGWDKPSTSTEAPIFVLGMPRSGTTLLDRLLSTHPDVTSLGEYPATGALLKENPDHTDSMGDLDAQAKDWFEGLSGRVVDKTPYNFLRVPFLFGMFPGAKIIHLTRDWRDVMISNWFHYYTTEEYAWSYSLEEIKYVIRAKDCLMASWDGKIMDVPYEGLVTDPRFWMREIQEYCGLKEDWEFLDHRKEAKQLHTYSYEEVRKPISRASVGKWRNYQEFAPEVFRCR